MMEEVVEEEVEEVGDGRGGIQECGRVRSGRGCRRR